MYELIILSLLMREPIHGYLISKIINYIIYCQTHILHLKAQAKNLVEGEVQYHAMDLTQLEATLHILRRSTNHWQVDLEYANSLHEKEMALALAEPSTT